MDKLTKPKSSISNTRPSLPMLEKAGKGISWLSDQLNKATILPTATGPLGLMMMAGNTSGNNLNIPIGSLMGLDSVGSALVDWSYPGNGPIENWQHTPQAWTIDPRIIDVMSVLPMLTPIAKTKPLMGGLSSITQAPSDMPSGYLRYIREPLEHPNGYVGSH